MTKLTYLAIVGTCFISTVVHSQRDGADALQPSRDFTFDIQFGLVAGGPAQRMKNYLSREQYDDNVQGFFGTVAYPRIDGPGGYIGLSLGWQLSPVAKFGLEGSFAELGEAEGNRDGTFIGLGFKTWGVGGFYEVTSAPWVLRAGPQLMVNTVYLSEDSDRFNATSVSAGLKLQLSMRLWNTNFGYGTLGGFYVLSYGTEQGPFPVESDRFPDLEATPVNYGYGVVHMTIGFRL